MSLPTRPGARMRIARAIVGGVLAAAAVWLLPRPLTTLVVSVWACAAACAVWAAVLALRAARRRWPWIVAAVLLAAAIALVVFERAVLAAYPAVVVVALAATGVVFAVRTWRGSPSAKPAFAITQRVLDALGALTAVAAAIIAALWPDVTMLLLAWVIALAAAIAGIVLLLRGIVTARRRHPRIRLTVRIIATVLAVVVGGSSVGTVWIDRQRAPVDDFYAWNGAVPAAPGQLLRVAAYEGETPADARAQRILYSTTRADGSPAVASAVVAVPTAAPPTGGRLVLAWQHGTTGVAQDCAPSLRPNALSEYAIP